MFVSRVHPNRQSLGLILLAVGLAFTLIACGGKPSVSGKWEQVSGTGLTGSVGTLWEFFDDGTVNTGGMAAKYSWPDNNHLKVEIAAGAGFVYEFALSGDEITLKDSSSQRVAILKRYKEFAPSPQVIAGAWQKRYPDNSQCFRSLGFDITPQQMNFGADGTFSIQQEASMLSTGISMKGQFSASGNRIRITASGTKTTTGLFGFGASQDKIGGEMNCDVTLSRSRLVFKDSQGQITLYTRTK